MHEKISRMNFDSLPMTSFSIHNIANVFLHQSSCLTSNCNADDDDEELKCFWIILHHKN
jgi:hypothetical protein